MREVDNATMKIVVCVKQVPDSWAEKSLQPAVNTLDRGSDGAVLNEIESAPIQYDRPDTYRSTVRGSRFA